MANPWLTIIGIGEDGLAGHGVQRMAVQRGKHPGQEVADRHGLPGADDGVGQDHDPPGAEAGERRKRAFGIGDFGPGVGNVPHQASVGQRHR